MKPRPEIHNYLGVGHMGMGDHARALGAFEEAIRQSPGKVELLHNRAFVLEAMGRKDEATQGYREALRCDPDNVGVLLSLAIIIRASKLDESVSLLEHARDVAPRNDSVLIELSLSYMARGDHQKAIEVLQAAAECAPENHQPHYLMGLNLGGMNKVEEAVKAYRESIRRNEEHAESHCNLAGCLESQGLLDEALVEYRRGHELGSQDPGWAYDSERWVADCEKLVDWKNRLPAALETLGDVPEDDLRGFLRVCQLQKRHDIACRLWTEIIARDPEHAHDPHHGDGFHAALDAARALENSRARDQDAAPEIEKSALTWLEGDLAAIRKGLAAGSLPVEQARALLNAWKTYPQLEILRHPDRLADTEAWKALWVEVNAILESR
jgi:tetratricopeptide (TPR) repeat protein